MRTICALQSFVVEISKHANPIKKIRSDFMINRILENPRDQQPLDRRGPAVKLSQHLSRNQSTRKSAGAV
jgi:hypothetical protein